MAKVKSKGTLLKVDISATLTTVAQLLSVTPPTFRSLDYGEFTLDQRGTGKERELSGYTETDAFEAEMYWDPDLAVHDAIINAIIPDPPIASVWQILFVNTGASSINWTSTSLELGPQVPTGGDGLRATIKGEIDGLPVYTQ